MERVPAQETEVRRTASSLVHIVLPKYGPTRKMMYYDSTTRRLFYVLQDVLQDVLQEMEYFLFTSLVRANYYRRVLDVFLRAGCAARRTTRATSSTCSSTKAGTSSKVESTLCLTIWGQECGETPGFSRNQRPTKTVGLLRIVGGISRDSTTNNQQPTRGKVKKGEELHGRKVPEVSGRLRRA